MSGWSLASLSKVAKKFLHFTLAVSGVICCPMPPGPPAAEAGGVVTGAVGRAGGAEAGGLVTATGCVGSLMGGGAADAAGGAVCLTTVA